MSTWSYEDIELGDTVRDSISGLTGIVVAYTTWLNRCRRITVQPKELKDGKPVDHSCFDIEQLELIKKGTQPKKPFTGGDRQDVAARSAVSRF